MRKVNPVTAPIRMSVAAMLVMAACCASAQITIPASNTINTIAGAGLYAGDGGAATSARLNTPTSLAMDSAGDIYIADVINNCVRKVTAAGVITTIAGGPAGGYGGDGGPASLAQLEEPQGVALDGSGNLYIADTNNNRVREIIAKTGVIITVAGNGTAGYTGDGGPGASAELNTPTGVAVDSFGNVYFADSYNNVVREVSVSTGNIATIAGNGTGGYAGDSGPATAAELSSPQAVAVDSANNVYIADTYNSLIRKVTAATGIITTVAGNDNDGFSGDNGAATSAELYEPEGVAVDSAGNIYIADSANNRVRKVTVSTGVITTVAGNGSLNFSGDGGQATSAALNYPYGVMVDASKNIYIADTNDNRIRKVTASTGIINTMAGSTSYAGNGGAATIAVIAYPESIRLDTAGDIFIVDTANQVIREVAASTGLISTVAGNGTLGYSGDGGAATSAQLNYPADVAIDSSGNLYIADTFNSCIRKVTTATKIITTIAGKCGIDTFQNDLQPNDNGPATSATLWYPTGVALDSAGNLYIADDHNSVVRKVSKANGYITLFAGTYNYSGSCGFGGDGGAATSAVFCAPYGVTLDSSGDVFISDYANNDIREVLASNGIVQTVAGSALALGDSGDGGPAVSAVLNQPQGMAIDSGGNLYFADFGNNSIRKINLSSNLDITTVAGTGLAGFYGDTKAAVSAELFWPYSVAVDASGNLYIADTNNNRIRAVGKPKAVAPAVSWPAPATIAYGTSLSATQLNATATVPGTFSYSPAAGQVLPLGSNTLSVTFTPTDTVDYTTATAHTTISVIQAVPKITWATPAAIPVGTALSSTQLNATANTAGTFTYSPAAGVVLAAGTQTLSVNFAPSNTTEYAPATASVQLTVTASTTAGIIHTFAGTGTAGYNGDGVAATSAELDGPEDVVVDSSGNVYIADEVNARIRKVATTGIITTFAGTGTNGSGSTPTSSGPATSINLGNAVGLGVDTSGNVYYADATLNVIRKITVSTGIMAIVAGNGQTGYSGNGGVATSASLNAPSGVAVDSAGNLYISDTQNDVIRKVAASGGIISTIAGTALKAGYSGDGGAATSATLNQPTGIAVDSSGNIYIADTLNSRVRKITAATGIITTYAGNGTQGASGDGGPASSAGLWTPQGISLDSQGNLFIADWSSMSVREVSASTGIIATVAGTGVWGYNGDGIPATSAELKSPFGVRAASNGNMYIADTVNNRVRVVGASKIAPNFTWATPAPIYYGTPLSATQLDASAAYIPGTITYSEQVGTVLKAGVYNLSAVFVPTSSNYSIETAEVLLTVNPAPAPVSWPQPADITNGAALSATQLDATSTIPGSFVYSPTVGTVLTQGPHLLSVTFTPTDTVDYVPTTVTVAITVSGGTTTYDAGNVAFVANGTTLGTASYGQTSTPATIAAALATAVNGNPSTTVTLKAVDYSLYITAVTAGAAGDSISYAVENTAYNTSAFSGPSFPGATISGNLEGGAASGTDAGKLVYSYNDGYDAVGNMTSSTDSVMGNWTFTPDTLSRLVGATNVPVPVATSSTSYYCWSYDAFGNRNLQGISSKTFASAAPACTPQESASYQGVWAHYAAGNNRFSNTQQAIGGVSYDGAGNILNDGVNQYLYDGEGRICAVASGGTGEPVLTGYIYNAEGERVSKGSITAWSCDPGVNGFKPLSDYVLGLSGEQVTEMGMNPSGSMAWQHTNVYAFGQVMATYDNDGLHFYLNDPLGTRRAQTDYAGVLEQTCLSLPFGDALNCTNSVPFPTEHHFTGKERDTESGLDYFGARYYGSSMGRFMSADWAVKPEDVPYADLMNPQSLNLYSYVNNNPLSKTDKDGHCAEDFCVVEGGVTAYFAGAAALAGASAYFSTPTGQRSLDTFTSAAGASFSNSFHTLTSFFSQSTSTPAASSDKPSTLAPGPHAGEGTPARSGDRNFTPGEREAVNAEGTATGCHTCGTKDPGTKSGNFVPDHQPPTALNPSGGEQKLYPQCINCSRTQGGEVNAARQQVPAPPPPPPQPPQQTP
jgi:RHS repeat-associated protein